jgi:hypothetical protein
MNIHQEGCMRSTQQQLGTWEPSQHSLEDRAKPGEPVSRWLVAGGPVCTHWLLASSPACGGPLSFSCRRAFKSFVFWDVTPCSPTKVNGRSRGTYLHFQELRVREGRNKHKQTGSRVGCALLRGCHEHSALPITVRVSNIETFSPYLTGNTLRLRYKAQPVNAV